MNYLQMVGDFHSAFEVGEPAAPTVGDVHPAVPVLMEELSGIRDALRACGPSAVRLALLVEEIEELGQAMVKGDKIAVLDGLCDLQVILAGTVRALGFTAVFNDAFREVHLSNMTKLGEDGKPVRSPDNGKILKGPNYRRPDLRRFVK